MYLDVVTAGVPEAGLGLLGEDVVLAVDGDHGLARLHILLVLLARARWQAPVGERPGDAAGGGTRECGGDGPDGEDRADARDGDDASGRQESCGTADASSPGRPRGQLRGVEPVVLAVVVPFALLTPGDETDLVLRKPEVLELVGGMLGRLPVAERCDDVLQ